MKATDTTFLSTEELIALAVKRDEGRLAKNGALVVLTGKKTGRSPNDKFVVQEPSSEGQIAWGKVNQPISEEKFSALLGRVQEYLTARSARSAFQADGFVGADPKYRLATRLYTETAWHALFTRQLFLRYGSAERPKEPDFTIYHAPFFPETFIIIHFGKKIVLIGGTQYAGEIKKSMFTVMNYWLPQQGVFPMHCSANADARGNTALFFGLSGTGKTTLSADPNRKLIGDDEHGWSDHGIFNFEGGCYAKCIRLSPKTEPQIWNAIRPGAVVENVVMNGDGVINYDDESITENTRAGYPVEFIENAQIPGVGKHPKTILFLTCDAFGVLPPISRLTTKQAMEHFLSGYTAKVAGTESGVTEPQVTFSTCFGAPFLPLPPKRYAELLQKKLSQHKATVYLVNTGWQGGPYGVGQRMSLPITRTLVTAALDGSLDSVETTPDPVFGLPIPNHCHGVDSKVLHPRESWKNASDYDTQARELAGKFAENLKKLGEIR